MLPLLSNHLLLLLVSKIFSLLQCIKSRLLFFTFSWVFVGFSLYLTAPDVIHMKLIENVNLVKAKFISSLLHGVMYWRSCTMELEPCVFQTIFVTMIVLSEIFLHPLGTKFWRTKNSGVNPKIHENFLPFTF